MWGRRPADVPPGSADSSEAIPPSSGVDWLEKDGPEALVRMMLQQVIDPEVGVNIIDLGLVYGVEVVDGAAKISMTMTTPGCPLTGYFEDTVGDALWGTPGVDSVDLQIVWDPPWSPQMMTTQAKRELGWPV